MLTGKYILGDSKHEIKQNMKGIEKLLPKKIERFSKEVKDLFEKIFKLESEKRISWTDFFKHKIFYVQEDEEELIIDREDAGILILKERINKKEFFDFLKKKKVEGYFVNINGAKKKKQQNSAPIQIGSFFEKNEIEKITQTFSVGEKNIEELLKLKYKKIINLNYHKINQYVYIWTLAKRSVAYSKSESLKFLDVRLNELVFVLLKAKKKEIESIRRDLQQNKNIFSKKHDDIFKIFLENNKELTLKYYDKLIELYTKELTFCHDFAYDEQNITKRRLPKKEKLYDENLTKYQSMFLVEICEKIRKQINIKISLDEKKGFCRLLVEMYYIENLEKNFDFSNKKRLFGSWKEYYEKIQLMKFADIRKFIDNKIK
jgi:hypothetical protein